MRHSLFLILLACCALSASAQRITFDEADFRSLSIYDRWPNSPLRDGRIVGIATVGDNPMADTLNPSARAAMMVRSRYGSNLLGLRTDLIAPFRLTRHVRYVHVRVWRPVDDGRLVLITLGKRSERKGQSPEVEQTITESLTPVPAGQWADAVFPIKGFSDADPALSGIDIYSLVICPDVIDRSTLASDFAVYIDDIEINDNPHPRHTQTNNE